MKLTEYIRQYNRDLVFVSDKAIDSVRMNHVYTGNLSYVQAIETGSHLFLIQNKDIEGFRCGKNELSIRIIHMHQNYTGNKNVSLSHVIGAYANGLLIDEIETILSDYANKGYSIISASDYGQFFTYLDFDKEKDYQKRIEESIDFSTIHLSFSNPELKEEFLWTLEDTFPVEQVMEEMKSLKRCEDVFFVHHDAGVGYACKDLNTLDSLAGFVYSNYLLVADDN